MGLKLAVVGGGSTYTPELIEGFARPRRPPPVDELVLLDIDPERLEIVGGLARRMLDRLGWPGRLDPDRRPRRRARRRRLRRSSSSASAARRPGSSTRRFPPRFGTIGQETTGAGGFAKALRTVPVVLDLAERRPTGARRRAPGSSTSRTRSGSSPRRCSTTATGRSGCATSRSASSAGSPRASASSPSGSSSSTSG